MLQVQKKSSYNLQRSRDSCVQIGPFSPRRLSWMLSLTAARAHLAQGASQFAAGYAAVRLTHHSDDRPVHLTKTR